MSTPTLPHPDTAAEAGVTTAHLRRAGVSVVLRLAGDALPCVVHWGAELPDLGDDDGTDLLTAVHTPTRDSVVYQHPWAAVLPQHTDGWIGRPGLRGSRGGTAWAPTYSSVVHDVRDGERDEPAVVTSTAEDERTGLRVRTDLELHPSGLLRLRATVTNTGADGYRIDALEPALPVPATADEVLDMAGRHARERVPQRRTFDQGQWVREAWGGRPGHESPTVMCAGRRGFGFRAGEVWGIHLAWSGNQVLSAEHAPNGWRLLRGGELLLPDEVVLASGESYSSPWLLASHGEGLDAWSHRFHDHLRARPHHPRRERPVLLNTWEAAYFDLDVPTLLDLADRAADLGVERFVLDDGWFRGRRDDTSSLGDWEVDDTVFPDGLGPLADRVQSLGMELGLWFEPEMVSLDSDLARAHPEWVLGTEAGPGIPSRFQHVLDLTVPEAWEHVHSRISALVAEHDIAYLKWDHNRPLIGAGSGPERRAAVHRQTEAVYRMLDALKADHPGLEIESCCGGGGRIDLGILERTDRVWVSDCIDAHERHRMVPWTGLTLPPELMGTHVGSGADHVTGRRHTLRFRAATALWGHMGVEWDLSRIDERDRAELAGFIALHKQLRGLLHHGRVVHADLPDPALHVDGVVAEDGSEAIYRLSALDTTRTLPAGRVGLPGLDPRRRYAVSPVPLSLPDGDRPTPAWFAGVTLDGRTLEQVGLMTPFLDVDDCILVRVVATA